MQEVLGEFLGRRGGDRVGLVVFGDAPFLQAPFTTDLELSRRLLDETAIGMAGTRTALGDAIGLGLILFEHSDAPAKTIIALTDGNDIDEPGAADRGGAGGSRARHPIHTVAIGDPTTVGEEKLDEETLRAVAQTMAAVISSPPIASNSRAFMPSSIASRRARWMSSATGRGAICFSGRCWRPCCCRSVEKVCAVLPVARSAALQTAGICMSIRSPAGWRCGHDGLAGDFHFIRPCGCCWLRLPFVVVAVAARGGSASRLARQLAPELLEALVVGRASALAARVVAGGMVAGHRGRRRTDLAAGAQPLRR